MFSYCCWLWNVKFECGVDFSCKINMTYISWNVNVEHAASSFITNLRLFRTYLSLAVVLSVFLCFCFICLWILFLFGFCCECCPFRDACCRGVLSVRWVQASNCKSLIIRVVALRCLRLPPFCVHLRLEMFRLDVVSTLCKITIVDGCTLPTR